MPVPTDTPESAGSHHALEQTSSEASFAGIESSPGQMAVLVKKAENKISTKTSAAALMTKIEGEAHDEAVHIGEEGPQAATAVPQLLPKYEPEELYSVLRNVQSFVTWPADRVFLLLSSDHIRVRSEFDVYEAAHKWFVHSYYGRKQYLQSIMSCPRWAYMTVQDMLRVRNLDPQFFHHKIVHQNVSRAKWFQDLLARGVTWKDYRLPSNRLLA